MQVHPLRSTHTVHKHTHIPTHAHTRTHTRTHAYPHMHTQVKLFQLSSGFCFVTFAEHTAPVTSVAFLPSGQALVSASLDGTVRAYDLVRYVCVCVRGHCVSLFVCLYVRAYDLVRYVCVSVCACVGILCLCLYVCMCAHMTWSGTCVCVRAWALCVSVCMFVCACV